MNTFWIRIRAPFAAFRGFQAGVYRSTSPVMPPSTAYGLVLNLAGIEMREELNGPITGIRHNVPPLRIATGLITYAQRNSLYQQLHGYRVGTDEKTKMMASLTKGAKYQVVPVRREVLTDYEGVIGVQSADDDLITAVEGGLTGYHYLERYGLPFAGDNNYLFDKISVITEPPENVIWYARLSPGESARKGSCRLTVGINRLDNSKTTSFVYAPADELNESIWTWTPAEPNNALGG